MAAGGRQPGVSVSADRPLEGRTVVVTRAEEQGSGLVGILQDLGATVLQLPTIRIADPGDGGERLRAAAEHVGDYEWVVFTSVNAVERLVPLLGRPPAIGTARVAAIGAGTADALAGAGLDVDLVPERFVAESLLEAFPESSGRRRVLVPRAAVAREILPDGLRAAGWVVDVVEAYRTERARPPAESLAAAAVADAITFTSASSVGSYLDAAGVTAVPPVVACIGPVTAAAASERGLGVDVVAEVHTMRALAEALAAHMGHGAQPLG
ncbi:MAG: uroporphyrinogen-III synthase [Actinomycetota bacterium]|nr:uroporphyrinogen-III synthase [Actinomycetota bacterium]